MTKKEILLEIRALIVKGWTQGAYERDNKGRLVGISKGRPVCWCLKGAINRVVRKYDFKNQSIDALFDNFLLNKLKYLKGIECWNDEQGRTKEEVLNLCDSIITSL